LVLRRAQASWRNEFHKGRLMTTEASPSAISPAAKRMRRHRERRRNKLRCFRIELRETEIDWLVRTGFLDHGSRFDKVSVLKAFYIFLDRTLGA
jgi:hypothetical protein